MSSHGSIHRLVYDTELGGVEADEMRREFGNAGSGTCCVGGEIGRAERANLAEVGDTFVGLDLYNGRFENFD